MEFRRCIKKEEKILREYFNTTYKNKKEKESLTSGIYLLAEEFINRLFL